MRAQHHATDDQKIEDTDAATPKNAPIPPKDRGFGAFGAILISFVVALLGTAAVVSLFDVSWVWWFVIFISFGVTAMAALTGLVYLKDK